MEAIEENVFRVLQDLLIHFNGTSFESTFDHPYVEGY